MTEPLPRPDPRDPEKLAYAAGRRDADVDSHLRDHAAQIRSHEERLNRINGSIDRNAQETVALRAVVEALDGKVDAVVTALEKKAAVEQERNRLFGEANEKQISNRTFVLGVVTICVVLVIGMATVYATLQAGGHG